MREEMMLERGLKVDHSTIGRWVLTYSPQIDERTRRHLKLTNDSWRVDETYIKVKGKWKYLYRAVDSEGNTWDFMLSARRNKKAAFRFFKKVLKGKHNRQQASYQCRYGHLTMARQPRHPCPQKCCLSASN